MDSCDDLVMTEHLGSTKFDTVPGSNNDMCNSKNYAMTDWNWQVEDPSFQPDIACAYYLPPLEGCRWELELVKDFDPIVVDNNCDCNCEDHVLFEEVDDQADNLKKEAYCDHTGGWCANNIGPDNILGLLPFTTGKNLQHCISNHVTQFSINISGVCTY